MKLTNKITFQNLGLPLPKLNEVRELGPILLTHPQIPKPLHGVNPRSILGQEWWDISRRIVYARAGFKCEACGVPKEKALFHPWLECHEVYHIDYKKGIMHFRYLVALCHACHNFIHQGRLSKTATYFKKQQILSHGYDVLRRIGLDEYTLSCTSAVAWEDWRLELFGELYPPIYPSPCAWSKNYNDDPRETGPDMFEGIEAGDGYDMYF